MKRHEASRKGQGGGVTLIVALILPVLAVMMAAGFNMALDFADKRRYQAVADLTALKLAQTGTGDVQFVLDTLATQGLRTDDIKVSVEKGSYRDDPAIAPANRFVVGGTDGSDAVRVTITLPIREDVMSGLVSNPNDFVVSATATIRGTASVSVGSRLLRLEGGLSAAILNAALGYDGRITLMDYERLIGADISVLTMLDTLNTNLSLEALTYDAILQDNLGLGDVIDAVEASALVRGQVPDIPVPVSKRDDPVRLGDFIILGQVGKYRPGDGAAAGVLVANAGDVVGVSTLLASGERQVELDLSAGLGALGIADGSLYIGDPAKIVTYDYSANPGKAVKTTQMRLDIELLRGLGVLDSVELGVGLADAEARIDRVVCDSRREVTRVDVAVKTSAADVELDAPLIPVLDVSLSDGDEVMVSFSAREIDDRVMKTASSGLGLDVNGHRLLLRPLLRAVDGLLEKLGLHTGEADIRVLSANCSRPFLVK